MHHFVLIRYSVYAKTKKSWRIGRGVQHDEYKEALFEPSRLELHQKLFFDVTIPSLVAANNGNVTVLVFTSESLPELYLASLKAELDKYPWMRLVALPENIDLPASMNSEVEGELKRSGRSACYSTVRLDDDDGIGVNFFTELEKKYMSPKFYGFSISFALGYFGVFDGERFESFHSKRFPMCAQGLTFVNYYESSDHSFHDENVTIFSLGSHVKVDSVRPVVVDSRNPMYIRTVHAAADTAAGREIDKLKKIPEVSPTEVKSAVNFN